MDMKFDPMTGQPVNQQQPQGQPAGYDPMTGQLINQQPQGQPTGFDPMTGQPVYTGSNVTFTPAAPAKTGLGTGVKIGIAAAAAVVVVGCAAFAAAKSGAFLKPAGKVELAISNTFSDGPEILEDINCSTILSSKNATLGMEASYLGQSVSAEYRCSSKKRQLEVTADITGASKLTAYVTLDDEALYLAAPKVLDDTLAYYYTKDNDGALIDAMGDDTVEQLNDLLKTAYSNEGQTEFFEEIKKEFDALEYKKISAETFEVDGKDRKCKGYETTITPDFINGLLDVYVDYIEDSMPDSMYSYLDWSSIREIQDEIDELDEIDVEFYIYKNKLAAICTEIDGEDIEILFKGGDYRLQNVEIVDDDETYIKLEGEKDGTTETIKLKAMGETVLKAEYDTKSGDFSIKVDDETIKGNIENSRKGVTLSITKVSSLDGLKMTIYANKSAEFADVDEKDIFDLGNADESDFEDLADSVDTDVLGDYANLLFGFMYIN